MNSEQYRPPFGESDQKRNLSVMMTPEDYRNIQWQKTDPLPDKIKAENLESRKLLLWIPLGAIIGLAASVICGSGGMFFPVWGVSTLLMYCFSAGSK